MRIISKFHDYYDGVMKQGADLEIIYNRETSVLPLEHKQAEHFPVIQSSQGYYSSRDPKQTVFELMYFGFCGKIIPAVHVSFQKEHLKVDNFIFSFDEFKRYCEEENLNVDFKKKQFSWRKYSLDCGKDYEDFFKHKETQSLEKIFFEYKTPVFAYKPRSSGYKTELIINPVLKDLQFFKHVDAYSCFQEIFMFIAGVLLTPEKPMITVSNQDKIDKHGFDKWSFRKKSPSSKD